VKDAGGVVNARCGTRATTAVCIALAAVGEHICALIDQKCDYSRSRMVRSVVGDVVEDTGFDGMS
jgi:hypothetical protein